MRKSDVEIEFGRFDVDGLSAKRKEVNKGSAMWHPGRFYRSIIAETFSHVCSEPPGVDDPFPSLKIPLVNMNTSTLVLHHAGDHDFRLKAIEILSRCCCHGNPCSRVCQHPN